MDKKFLFIVGGGLLVILILIIVLVITSKPKSGQTKVVKDNTITIWDYKNEKSAFDPSITSFQRSNDIKIQYVQKNPASYIEDTVSAIAAGNGPDIWIVPNNLLPKIKDKLVPMPAKRIADEEEKKDDLEVYKDTFPFAVSQDSIFDNKVYAMPIAIDTLKLYINSQIMTVVEDEYRQAHQYNEDDNVRRMIQEGPKTWDDLVNLVKLTTKKTGDKIDRSAIAMGTSDNITNASDILTLIMMQNGTKMTSDDFSTAQFHTSQNLYSNVSYPGKKSLDFYASFADPKNANYTWNNSMQDSVRAFAEGKTAMMIDYSSAQEKINNINAGLFYRVIDIPQIRETQNPVNFAEYDTIVVPKTADNPDMAWSLIIDMTTTDLGNPYRDITKKSIAQAKYLEDKQALTAKSWYNPDPTKTEEIFKTMIKQANEGKDTQTALDGAAGQITTLLGKLKGQ